MPISTPAASSVPINTARQDATTVSAYCARSPSAAAADSTGNALEATGTASTG